MWKVSYEQKSLREGRRPFFKQSQMVKADSRKAAIDRAKYLLYNHWDYDNFRASKKA